jgi:hypothetical protein
VNRRVGQPSLVSKKKAKKGDIITSHAINTQVIDAVPMWARASIDLFLFLFF